jgi:hypothetical protein
VNPDDPRWILIKQRFFQFHQRWGSPEKMGKRPGKYGVYIWANYNDLTATSLESWLVRENIPK